MKQLTSVHCLGLILALGVIAGLSGCATGPKRPLSAQERASRATDLFASIDANGDGFLTREELEGGLRYYYTGNTRPGFQTSDVMLGLKDDKRKKRAKPSRNLTVEEINRAVREAFAVRDENLDNRLSQDEFKKLVVERPAESDPGPSASDTWEAIL